MKTQNNKNKILGGFSIMTFFLLFTITANAQFELPTLGSVKPAIILNSDPATPLPNSAVTITANISGPAGANGSNYTWFLNGSRQTAASGLNKNIFSLTTGNIGEIYRIGVNVALPNGENLSDSINLTVSDIDLTWITNSYAPIFYKAKLMPTQNSLVTISALPFIYRPGTKTLIGSGNLIYNWMPDGKIDSSKSGLGKFSYALRISNYPGNAHFVRLEIRTDDGAVSLSKDALIPVAKPQILLYFSDPLTGLPFGAALKNFVTKPVNLHFAAQTYFFTAPAKNLKWQWFINNSEVSAAVENPWLAALDLANYFSGAFSAQIKVSAQNSNNELEMAQSITNLEVK